MCADDGGDRFFRFRAAFPVIGTLMRVLHLRSSLIVGSPEQLILSQIRAIGKRAHSEVAILPDQGSDAFHQAATAQNVRTHIISSVQSPRVAARHLASILRNRRVDVLCTHDFQSNLVGWLATRRVRRHQVSVFHGRLAGCHEARDDWILRRVDAVVAVSKATRERLKYLSRPVHVIQNALDTECFNAPSVLNLRDALALDREVVLIGTAGRLSPEKGQALLLKAFEKVSREHPKVRLAIAGEGPARPALEDTIARLGLQGRAHLLGWLNDLAPFYRALDVFVLPSLTECLPLAILEAGFFGKAVIASDVGGVREAAKNGVSALLIPPGSTGELVQAITRLVEMRELRERLGQSGREVAINELPFSSHVNDYLELYAQLGRRDSQ